MKHNIFENTPINLENEFFQTLLQNKNITIEKIVSKGHTSPKSGWYDQEQNEWVILLEGEAVLSFETKEDIRLKKGDFINIAAHEKHKVSWTSLEYETIWLAVFYK